MPFAQGIRKQTIYKKQTAKGTAASGAGGQRLRRRNAVFTAPVETFETDEILAHRQSTGVGFGPTSPQGKIEGVLSPGTYKDLLQSLLMRDFATVAASTGLSITIAASGANYTITRSTGSWLSDGVKIGFVGRLTAGAFNANNLNKNVLVLSMTATVLTVKVLGKGLTMTAEGPIASATFAVTGKVTYAPATGQTDDWYTFEEFYADIPRSETFPDSKIAKASITVPATGNATISIDVVSLARVLGAAQVLTSPTTETTTDPLVAVTGAILIGGAAYSVTTFNLEIDAQIAHSDAVIGTNDRDDVNQGDLKVMGSLAIKYDGAVLQAIKDAGSTAQLVVVIAEDATANTDFISLIVPLSNLTSDDPDDGKKQIVRTYSFVGKYNAAGGSGQNTEQTIIQIQDSAA